MLIVFSGLPGTGKSTLARALAARLRAALLRIDTIEQALRAVRADEAEMGPDGYLAGYAIAADNLSLGRTVVADAVNPVDLTRDAWRTVGERAGVPVVEIEIACSDRAEHRRRVETRVADIDGLVMPTWQNVLDRDYRPWTRDRLVVDTAGRTPEDCVEEIVDRLP